MSKAEPAAQSLVKQLPVGGTKLADDFDGQPVFHSGDLRFDAAGDVQAGFAPLLEEEVCVCELRGDWNEEKVGTVVANDNSRSNLAARQVRERDRQENDIIS